MRIALQRFRIATALSMAIWMVALACVTGYMPPAFGSPNLKQISCPQEAATGPAGMDLMANMPNCPHAAHHGPANPQGRKRTPSGGISCCFLELNVPTRMQTPQPQLVTAHLAVPVAIFNVMPAWTHSAPEFSLPVDYAGRDTLLQTHLLRI
jgi:hypothetical protein